MENPKFKDWDELGRTLNEELFEGKGGEKTEQALKEAGMNLGMRRMLSDFYGWSDDGSESAQKIIRKVRAVFEEEQKQKV